MEVSGLKTCEQGSKGYIENVCKPCEDDCKNTAADGWCRQCEEYMCSTCFRHHRKGKFCKDHELLDHRNSGSVPQKASASDEGLEKCRQHFKKLIKFYCPTHGQVGCGDCMVLEHKACNVVYIRCAMVKCNLIGLIQRSTSCDEVDGGKHEHSSLIPERAIKQETVNVSKAQSLLDRKLRTDNIHVDGDHLSFTHDNALQDDIGVYIRDVKMTNGSYFEVKIIRSGDNDSSVGIGIVPKDYPEQYFPGWGKSSVGYHTDDGCVFIENTSEGELLGQPCRKNDTVGCGITSKTLLGVNVFFAINGRKIGEKFLHTRRSLYPAVALDTSGQKVKVSFDALVPTFQTTE